MSDKKDKKVTRKELLKRAKVMRANPTNAERTMWERLRNKQLGGYKFRRQHIMVPYIVDFYCARKQLVVEIDGDVHDEEKQQLKDETRAQILEERFDVQVVRFSNEEVNRNLEGVLEEIWKICATT